MSRKQHLPPKLAAWVTATPRAMSATSASGNSSTLYDLVGSGEVPTVRISSRCVRFRREDLEAFIEARVDRRPQ